VLVWPVEVPKGVCIVAWSSSSARPEGVCTSGGSGFTAVELVGLKVMGIDGIFGASKKLL
jgi:hypothetical protein